MFNYNTLEQDIERLGKEVQEKKNLPEHQATPERELIKQVITPFVLQSNHSEPVQAASQSEPASQNTGLPDYLENSTAETKLQVEKLVESVFSEGLQKTIKKASGSNAFILDAFHDALTDKLYDELKKRNLI